MSCHTISRGQDFLSFFCVNHQFKAAWSMELGAGAGNDDAARGCMSVGCERVARGGNVRTACGVQVSVRRASRVRVVRQRCSWSAGAGSIGAALHTSTRRPSEGERWRIWHVAAPQPHRAPAATRDLVSTAARAGDNNASEHAWPSRFSYSRACAAQRAGWRQQRSHLIRRDLLFCAAAAGTFREFAGQRAVASQERPGMLRAVSNWEPVFGSGPAGPS